MEAMQSQTVDVVKRMKEITLVMQTPQHVLVDHGVTSQDIEGSHYTQFLILYNLEEGGSANLFFDVLVDLLDELQEHVESIDMANGKQKTNYLLLTLELGFG